MSYIIISYCGTCYFGRIRKKKKKKEKRRFLNSRNRHVQTSRDIYEILFRGFII